MENEILIYHKLQKHLDRQAVGYPATKSGAEISLLRRFFNPEEAQIAKHLSYKPTPIEQIYKSIPDSGISINALESKLDVMVKNGVIMHSFNKDGSRCYNSLPFIVGMFEGQLNNLTPELLSDIEKFTSEKSFGLSFLSTELPQMRTIPVGKSVQVKHHVLTYENLTDIINDTAGPFAIHKCICRSAAAIKGNPCKKTSREETCMALGEVAKNNIRNNSGREISREEAHQIVRQNEADGLVIQPGNSQKIDFICSCCGCCCGMLGVQKMLPKPVDFWATNHYASIDKDTCTGCGKCVERCQVNAVNIDKHSGIASVNLNRCIGCGNCAVTCSPGAMNLIAKEKTTVPPENSEELYDIIMKKKKGTLGKIKLVFKLILKR